LIRDPSKIAIKTSEEVTSITGIKTMSALGPTSQHELIKSRRTGYTKAEDIMKKRAENTKHLKRLIITASNTVEDEFAEQRKALISERLRQEDEEKMIQMVINSPVRKGDQGPVTFMGKAEHEDEVLRSHYLMNKIRTKDEHVPFIERDNPALRKKEELHHAPHGKTLSYVPKDFKHIIGRD
jgi:hypothetical protein